MILLCFQSFPLCASVGIDPNFTSSSLLLFYSTASNLMWFLFSGRFISDTVFFTLQVPLSSFFYILHFLLIMLMFFFNVWGWLQKTPLVLISLFAGSSSFIPGSLSIDLKNVIALSWYLVGLVIFLLSARHLVGLVIFLLSARHYAHYVVGCLGFVLFFRVFGIFRQII